MTRVLQATVIGFLVGVAGTACGGLAVLVWAHPTRRAQARLLGVSGGIMLAVVLFDLWPEAWQAGGLIYTALGTSAGVLLIGSFGRLLPARSPEEDHLARLARTGLLIGVSIGTHNFPEGVALGTAFAAARALAGWLGLALLMGLHNVPEGIIMAATLRLGRVRLRGILASLVLVEIPMGAGAMVGGIFGRLSTKAVATALAFAGGAMFFVVFKELLPTGEEVGGRAAAWGGTAVGMALGFLLTRVV